jgi:hypothetical protein
LNGLVLGTVIGLGAGAVFVQGGVTVTVVVPGVVSVTVVATVDVTGVVVVVVAVVVPVVVVATVVSVVVSVVVTVAVVGTIVVVAGLAVVDAVPTEPLHGVVVVTVAPPLDTDGEVTTAVLAPGRPPPPSPPLASAIAAAGPRAAASTAATTSLTLTSLTAFPNPSCRIKLRRRSGKPRTGDPGIRVIARSRSRRCRFHPIPRCYGPLSE